MINVILDTAKQLLFMATEVQRLTTAKLVHRDLLYEYDIKRIEELRYNNK